MAKKVFLVIFSIFIFALSAFAQEEPGESFSYDSHGKRDPFWPLVSASGTILNYDKNLSFSDMTLEGIIYEEGKNSLAIINSTIVKSGDNIGGYIVGEVKEEEAILLKGEEEIILKLRKEK